MKNFKYKKVELNFKSFLSLIKDIENILEESLEEAQQCMSVTKAEKTTKEKVFYSVKEGFDSMFAVFGSSVPSISNLLNEFKKLANQSLDKEKTPTSLSIKENVLEAVKILKTKINSASKDIKIKDRFEKVGELFPCKDTEIYQNMLVVLEKRILLFVAKAVLPTKWKIKKWPTYLVKDYYQIDGQNERLYDFDEFRINSFLDMSYTIQSFKAPLLEETLGTTYEHKTSDGHLAFQNWLKQICVDRRNQMNYQKYSSYYNWSEEADYTEGKKCFKAYKIHSGLLVDKENNLAPVCLTEWLFKDDVYGNSSTLNGLATRNDVYKNWGLEIGY